MLLAKRSTPKCYNKDFWGKVPDPGKVAARRPIGVTPDSLRLHGRIVLDDGERVVEVVQEPLPLLVLGLFSEPFGVVLEAFPVHEEDVPSRSFDAALELV